MNQKIRRRPTLVSFEDDKARVQGRNGFFLLKEIYISLRRDDMCIVPITQQGKLMNAGFYNITAENARELAEGILFELDKQDEENDT